MGVLAPGYGPSDLLWEFSDLARDPYWQESQRRFLQSAPGGVNVGDYAVGPYYGGGAYTPGAYEQMGGYVQATAAAAATPKKRTFTFVVEQDPYGGSRLVEAQRGRPFLTRKDFSSFLKVCRLRGRLNRLLSRGRKGSSKKRGK